MREARLRGEVSLHLALGGPFHQAAFLRDGVDCGNMPRHTVSSDLADGTLVSINVEGMVARGFALKMTAFHRASELPVPASRWLIDDLKARDAEGAG